MAYSIVLVPGWDINFSKMDNSIQQIIWKKIQKQKEETQTRHLRFGVEFYVIESGQYRIAIKIIEEEKIKKIHFVGNHKQYEKWYKKQKA
ncbi:MAG: hypothetical protein Q7S21_01680 [archaeon]|nr:hypothetical protein [archaeon]